MLFIIYNQNDLFSLSSSFFLYYKKNSDFFFYKNIKTQQTFLTTVRGGLRLQRPPGGSDEHPVVN